MGREGFDISERRFRHMYRAQNLQVRARKKRHVQYVRGTARVVPQNRINAGRSTFCTISSSAAANSASSISSMISRESISNWIWISHSQAVRLRASSMKSNRTAADIPPSCASMRGRNLRRSQCCNGRQSTTFVYNKATQGSRRRTRTSKA